ncbi:hypothetical protein PMAYCL1PPCAC_04630, partial [Pristionchus mayeri]
NCCVLFPSPHFSHDLHYSCYFACFPVDNEPNMNPFQFQEIMSSKHFYDTPKPVPDIPFDEIEKARQAVQENTRCAFSRAMESCAEAAAAEKADTVNEGIKGVTEGITDSKPGKAVHQAACRAEVNKQSDLAKIYNAIH